MHKSLEDLLSPEHTAWYTNALRIHVEILQKFLDEHEPLKHLQVAVVRDEQSKYQSASTNPIEPLTEREITTLREMITCRPTLPFVS